MHRKSLLLSSASGARTGGVALCCVLLAAPVLLIAGGGMGALVATLLVATAAALEWRPRAAPRSHGVQGLAPVLAPVPSRSRLARAAPRAHWELVERDGRRTLSMRWS